MKTMSYQLWNLETSDCLEQPRSPTFVLV